MLILNFSSENRSPVLFYIQSPLFLVGFAIVVDISPRNISALLDTQKLGHCLLGALETHCSILTRGFYIL